MPIRLTQKSAALHDRQRGERRVPTTLLEFQRAFPDDAACAAHMEKLRWPKGFVCPRCSVAGDPYRVKSRPSVS